MPPRLPADGAAPLPPDARFRRAVVLVLGGGSLVLSLFMLQDSFDAGDRRRALAALETTPAGAAGDGSLAEALRRLGGGAAPGCAAEVLSAMRGITRVTCLVGGEAAPYRFLWDDLKRDALRPEDEATGRRLAR
jgi:hypothetical protein